MDLLQLTDQMDSWFWPLLLWVSKLQSTIGPRKQRYANLFCQAVKRRGAVCCNVFVVSFKQEVKTMEERKVGVKGLGERKQMNQSTLFGRTDIEVPRGRLAPSEHKDSPLEYNEYAAYDPNQVSIRFLVAVKYEEQGVKKGRNPGSEKT
ncbi:hypothetical protein HYC85_032011 [Camellia sinensis]|uniref:Poly [ADP-ribose] polymerase n=1 Tax=Camellia sinensis TaxID=4442 RepID=A0A7J7FU04_CAMSI|nr:hypothetical protein HYC85_032011 [Camellia sinensis]